MKLNQIKKLAAGIALAAATTATHAEISANAAFSNNYLWRGLTQTTDEPAISGGIDYSDESGFYAGTWVSNVKYAADDAFSYEHDLYFGYAGEAGDISYDVGYLYVNYNHEAAFDFSEVYASVGYQDFSATIYLLATTEPDEEDYIGEDGGTADFGFGSAYYLSLDYGFDLGNDWSLGLHAGYHDGDFVETFNFADGQTFNYVDYNFSLAKDAFTFTVSDTDVNDSTGYLANGDVKYVVSYSFDI